MTSRGFTKGLIIGGVLGAAASMMMEPGTMNNKTRRKMIRNGRNLIRTSGSFLGEVIDIFR